MSKTDVQHKPATQPTVTPGVLRAKDLVKRYGQRTVVDHVAIEVKPGEIVGLLGPNGAGKTTSFYMLVGLIRPNAGHVFLGETDITRLPMYRRARLGLGYLPQEASVFRKLTVAENLHAVLEMRGMPRRERDGRVDLLLEEFRLTHRRDAAGGVLSGGERRRVEIARTLASEPAYILLDEPFTGVDPIAVDEIQEIVRTLRDKGIGVLITDHNVRETLAITERSYIIFDGKILTHGNSQEIANDPVAQRHYLGDRFSM
ncbi:MAG TPA: LPS export ABC transporter ATP-binding protein [Armatimonadota bacterium]